MKVSTWTLVVAAVFYLGSINAQLDWMVANKHYEMGEYNLAVSSYQKMIENGNADESTMVRMADALRQMGKLREAAEWYGKVASMDKPSKEFLFQYAQTLKSLGQYKEAKSWFLKYAEINSVKGLHYALSCDYAMVRDGNASIDVKALPVNSTWSEANPLLLGNNFIYSTDRTDLERFNGQACKGNSWIMAKEHDRLDDNELEFLWTLDFNDQSIAQLSYAKDQNLVCYVRGESSFGLRPAARLKNEMNIQVAELINDWDMSQSRSFPHKKAGFADVTPMFNEDGTQLYFASNRPGGYGGFDLYVSYLNEGQWTYPQNLGSVINSPGDELYPYFDGSSLYFSSDYHFGLGGLDLFKTQLQGFEWSRLEHLEAPINSPMDDYQYVEHFTGDRAVFVSNRSGNDDMYSYTPPALEGPLPLPVAQTDEMLKDVNELIKPELMTTPQKLGARINLVLVSETPLASVPNTIIPEGLLKEEVVETEDIKELTEPAALENVEKPVETIEVKDGSSDNSLEGFQIRLLKAGEPWVYFIQVAALKNYKNALPRFQRLRKVAHVYKFDHKGIHRIRVGYFKSMPDALQALKEVKALGYKDAFVTREKMDPAAMELILTASQQTVQKSSEEAIKVWSGKSKYMVRLTAYNQDTQFDTKSVEDLGRIEQWTKRGWKIIMLSGYANQQEAKMALAKAKTRGYKDAYLVMEKDGFLQTVEE